VAERLFGIETEYALAAIDGRGKRVHQGQVLDGLMQSARRRLPHLPDELSHGLFLQNAARFYVDAGGHPEFTTPECSNPWDVVRYVRAGESILLRLADGLGGQRPRSAAALFRCNVDYSGTGSTWGSHESYMHRADPASLPKQIIPHLVSRLVYTGAGGFKNVGSGIEFTLSPRTTHISTEVSSESTSHRGIFHDKDEDLCGNRYHRLHILCGESLCSELATWLRVGATALVVAMCEAGLRPGEAVALRAPLEAMRLFAGDPTCRATAETVSGQRLTAVAVQRHYLEQAEAHVDDAFMPPWAGEVCRQWRAVLDCLNEGWESAATKLDWAIKLGLYKDRVRRRGLVWESLRPWSQVVERLSTAWARAKQGGRSLRAEVVLGEASPIAAEVERMTPLIRELGLRWPDLGPFLEIRNELFEIDTRFGQLGEQGIFAALDLAGVLTHHVQGVDDVEDAVEHPPDVARARLRGQLVRELSGNDSRYCCDWEGVWDCVAGKCIDLSDPFVAVREWKDWPGEGEVMPPGRFLASVDERLLMTRAGTSTPDPIALNQTAFNLRLRGQLDEAERLLRQAIEIEDTQVAADSPKRPHRRNHLAMVLMRAGKLVEARQFNAEAWRLKAGRHDLVSGRILFVRMALRFLVGDRNVGLYVGQLKTLLHRDALDCPGAIALFWEVPDVLTTLREKLNAADAELFIQAVEALNDRAHLASLDAFEVWNAAPAVPLEVPWPDA
jgi:proteasome accessory factor A